MIVNGINSAPGGIEINSLFNDSLKNLNSFGEALQLKMKEISEIKDSNAYQTEMLKLQFFIGQYNAILEMTSSVTKSLTDMMKTLAQRSS